MSGLRLPSTLLELVLARTYPSHSTRHASTALVARRRTSHTAAALQSHSGLLPEHGAVDSSLYMIRRQEPRPPPFTSPVPRTSSAALEKHAENLKNLAGVESTLSYTEEELLAVYDDLLALPASEKPDAQAQTGAASIIALQTVQAAVDRLCQSNLSSQSTDPPYRLLLDHLSQATPTEATGNVPVAALSKEEWQAVIQCAVDQKDAAFSEQAVELMKEFGLTHTEEDLDLVLGLYASQGDISRADQLVKRHLPDTPSVKQRDLHIKAYVKALPQTAFPTQALQLLHDYEARALAPPQKTYARLINHLVSARSSVAHAHAWDLFSHMRYVAHPRPDTVMYTMMIRACASSSLGSSGEPERALDLFTEMTVDQRMQPTAGAYTAVILACARSGREMYIHEGLRLAKEMLDSHRDARGMSAFTLDRKFFCALLEGAKRIGDLGRVRWILAEMVKGAVASREQGITMSEDAFVQEDVMLHVFHAYAAYKPPFKPSLAPIVDAPPEKVDLAPNVASPEPTSHDLVEEPQMSFGQLPPQTRADVVREAEALFGRIVEDQMEPTSDNSPAVFQHVEITPRLLNAYLSIHYHHAPFDTWVALFKTLHADFDVPRNAWTFVDILERFAQLTRRQTRQQALQLSDEVWQEWHPLESAWRQGHQDAESLGIEPRLIERIHTARIKTLANTRNLDRAVDHVKAFAQAYPPSAVRFAPEKSPLRSTRTNLVARRPLVRLTSVVDVPDDTVPPLLTFTEVEVLHHRLVAANRVKDIKYLKWLCKAYDGSLRCRRDAVMHAQTASSTPAHPDVAVVQSQ